MTLKRSLAHLLPRPLADGPNREKTAVPQSGDTATKGFRFYDDAEILTLPDPEWLIECIVPANALVILYGPYESFKTFVALGWSFSLATARSWGPHDVEPGPVAYVYGEGHSGIKQRVRAWKQKNGFPEPERAGHGVHILPMPVQLLEPVQVDALVKAILEQLPTNPRLVVFDTLARCMAGGDENYAKDMGLVVQAADEIRAATGATVLIIHHSGYDGTHPRGSTALMGAADTVLKLRRRSKSGNSASLSCDKQKDAAPFDPIQLEMVEAGDSLTVVVSGPASPPAQRVRLAGNAQACLHALREVGAEGTTHGAWKDASGAPSSSFNRAIKRLLESGLVEREANTYRITTEGEDQLSSPTPTSVPRES
jgi:hypothetical protein